MTTSGTDGNNHGIYAGRKYLQLKSPESPPIIYYSKEVHHSVKNLADVQNMKRCQIQAEPMGEMDINDFRRHLNPSHPALIVIAIGTTFTGAIDDLKAVRQILKEKHKEQVYIHLDAALFWRLSPRAERVERKTAEPPGAAVAIHSRLRAAFNSALPWDSWKALASAAAHGRDSCTTLSIEPSESQDDPQC